MSHRLSHKPEREKVSSEFEPSSPGRNESGKETFDAAHSREELENLQQGEEQQLCELGELSLGLLTEGSCRQRAEGRVLAAPASAVLSLGGLG